MTSRVLSIEHLELGARIRAARGFATQQAVVDRVGHLGRSALAEIEAGRRGVDACELVRLARALHTTPEALLGIATDDTTDELARALAGLTNDQLADVALFAEFLRWRRAQPDQAQGRLQRALR